MYEFITILIIIVCVLLTLIVLIQKPKGGGVAANFSSSNQVMGVKRTTDIVEKITWSLTGGLFALALLINFAIDRENIGDNPTKSEIQDRAAESNTVVPGGATPTTPTQDEAPSSSAPANGGGNENILPSDPAPAQ